MADIRLAKPAAGASESVQCAPDARFVFDFPTTDATLAREGDTLNISFQDGSQLRLEGFYQEYNGDNLPSFNIDGTEVAAADFFQAMNEPDLMPAAGPGTGTVANGARFHEWGDSSLASGITHLNGLDWGFSRSFEWEDHPNAVGYNDDDGWRGAANTVPDLDVPAAPGRPYDPRNPGDDPNNPASPQNPGGYIPNTHGASIVVDEGALARGSGQHVLHGAHDFGSFVADVHAERGGSIELSFGGKVVTLAIPQDGSLRIAPAGDASFANVNGVDIRILGAESAGDGKWVVRYEYRLADHIEHDKLLGQDTVRYDGNGIAITVTDGSGDVARGRLTVEVHDDVPVLNSVSFAQPVVLDESDTDIRVNLDGLLTGADEVGAVLTVDVNGTVFVGHKGAGGEWAFEKGNDPEAGALRFENGEFIYTRPVADLDGDETNTYTFTATITDGDNDSVSRTNSITTIAKPKFNPDPEPTPDPTTDPTDPDPGDGKPAVPEGQVSSVVTDDSYVEGDTKAPAATPQTLAEGVAPDGGTDGTEPAAAAKPTNIASGSFSLTMNGQRITVTIAGENGAITLEFSADGQLESMDGPKDEAGHIQLASKEGYGLLEVVDTKVGDDNTITVNYTFTQTKAYKEHDEPENTNELAYGADSFTVRLEDALHQIDTGSIRVSIHDDAPVVTGGTFGHTFTEGEGGTVTLENPFTVDSSADGWKVEPGYSLELTNTDLTNTDGSTKYTVLIDGPDGQKVEAGLRYVLDEDGTVHGKAVNDKGETFKDSAGNDIEILRVSIDATTGEVTVKMTGNGTLKHGEGEESLILEGIKAVVAGEDGDGDLASGSAELEITIKDTGPTGAAGTSATNPGTAPCLKINFEATEGQVGSTPDKFKSLLMDQDQKDQNWVNLQLTGTDIDNPPYALLNNQVHYIFVNGIKIIASHTVFELTEDGYHILDLKDFGSGLYNEPQHVGYNKNLYLTCTGLGIGTNDDDLNQGHEMGMVTEGENYSTHERYDMEHNVAESVVLEPQNGTVWYELDLKLGNFGEGDRALVYFYMTPQNSNDNNIAYSQEITYRQAGLYDEKTGLYRIEVPDGFTKAIVSSMPTAKGESSSFTIAEIDFLKKAAVHSSEGEITFDAADGVESIAWDWTDVKTALDGNLVKVYESINADEYTVHLEFDQYEDGTNWVKATLEGLPEGDNILFTGTLGQDGKWSISQYYKFEYSGEGFDPANMHFTATVKDMDGDTTEVESAAINMAPEWHIDRFQDVKLGYWKDGWNPNAKEDNASDVLFGEEFNSLMYGRGGNDLMFGDGTGADADAMVKALFPDGKGLQWEKEIAHQGGKAGPNWMAGSEGHTAKEIWDNLSKLAEDGNKAALDAALDALEANANGAGDDALYGGLGNDMLFGGAGNDYLSGSQGTFGSNSGNYSDTNMLFGGSGDDIIVYGAGDVIAHGGSGVDVLLVSGATSFDDLKDKHVYDMEVLIRCPGIEDIQKLGITSLDSLDRKFDITIKDGVVTLGADWSQKAGNDRVYENEVDGNKVEVELNSSMQRVEGAGPTTFHSPEADAWDLVRAAEKTEGVFERLLKAYDISTAATAAAIVAHLVAAIAANPDTAKAIVDASAGGPGGGEGDPAPVALFSLAEEAATAGAADTEPVAQAGADHAPEIAAFAGADAAFGMPQTLLAAQGAPVAPEQDPADGGDPAGGALPDAASTGAPAGGEVITGEGLIFGTGAAETIIGSATDDFINGGAGSDTIYAGAGDDLIVYDPTDYFIDGGEGIDFLLSDGQGAQYTLAEMLDNYRQHTDADKPMVNDVEVMLKGVDTTSLQNMDALAEKYGFSIEGNRLILGDQWKEVEGSANGTTTTYANGDGITLETTLTEVKTGGEEAGDQAAQQIVLTSNG